MGYSRQCWGEVHITSGPKNGAELVPHRCIVELGSSPTEVDLVSMVIKIKHVSVAGLLLSTEVWARCSAVLSKCAIFCEILVSECCVLHTLKRPVVRCC